MNSIINEAYKDLFAIITSPISFLFFHKYLRVYNDSMYESLYTLSYKPKIFIKYSIINLYI